TICNGDSVVLTGSGATSYTWDNGVTDGIYFIPTTTTTYTVIGQDANGCSNTDTVTITVSICIFPQANFSISDSVICAGSCIDYTDLSADAQTWEWTFQGGDPASSTAQNPTVCYDSAGTYSIQLIVTNNFGADTLTSQIVVHPNPTIVAGSDVTIMFGNPANLISSTTSTGSFSWTPSFNVDCPTCQNTQANPEETTTYTVTLTDTNGCSASDTLIVTVEFENIIWVPNIFSPNGDGNNDILFVRGKGIQSVLFFIYDRWGEKVFETTDINLGWDGTYKGKPMNKAVFVYYVEATFMDGSNATKKGDVTLIR
ncbi:MAG: gliding motility-associated C-terminal domain-containing protein, partial [Vicingaceae bacterium]|nr:gliding motility-associated C-terminal domain-containing protein [Vicingaceae bacterium]